MKLLFFFVLCSSISFGCCLQCYQCLSARSWDDCDGRKSKVTCDIGEETCVKFKQESKMWGGSMYGKACVNTDAWCTQILQDKKTCAEHCEAYCCDKELCNGAGIPMASVITLVACALVALHR